MEGCIAVIEIKSHVPIVEHESIWDTFFREENLKAEEVYADS